MTIQSNPNPGLEKLRGVIANYRCTRTSATFVITKDDRNAIRVVAIAAGIGGLSGMAVSTAVSAGAEEDAGYLEFDLDGNSVKGFVWRSPFKEGDAVEVIAEWHQDRFELFAVACSKDRIVALYPHCSRGWKSHWKNALVSWLVGTTIILFFTTVLLGLIGLTHYQFLEKTMRALRAFLLLMPLGVYPIFLLMTISLAWKWMSFVRLAERIFVAFGWPDPSDIDLNKQSKKGKYCCRPRRLRHVLFPLLRQREATA